MNVERFEGICRQHVGRMIEIWGELTGDPKRAANGRRNQSVGRTQQRLGALKEDSARHMRSFLHRNRDWRF